MPNGKPGDHPLTDLLIHNVHAFPPDMEEMIRRLHKVNRDAFQGARPLRMLCDWENGQNLDQGRDWLRQQLATYDS